MTAFVEEVASVVSASWLSNPFVFFSFSGHGVETVHDQFPRLIPADGDPNDEDATVDVGKLLVEPLNKIKANVGRLHVAVFLDCCRSNIQNVTWRMTPATNAPVLRLRAMRNDFTLVFACDPGRCAEDKQSGGAMTCEFIRMVSADPLHTGCRPCPLPNLFCSVAASVESMGRQRPWVHIRGSAIVPTLFVNPQHSKAVEGAPLSICQAAGLDDIDLDGASDGSPLLPVGSIIGNSNIDVDRHTAAGDGFQTASPHVDVFASYWVPCIWLLANSLQFLLTLCWLCGIGNKLLNTRIAFMPTLASFYWAAFCHRASMPTEVRCTSNLAAALQGRWPSVELFVHNVWYPTCFAILGFGELFLERDAGACCVSCALTLLSSLVTRPYCLEVLRKWRLTSDNAAFTHAFTTWRALFAFSLFLSYECSKSLRSGAGDDLQWIESCFHLFLFTFGVTMYFTVVHRCDFACIQGSSSRLATAYMAVPLLATWCAFAFSYAGRAHTKVPLIGFINQVFEYGGLYVMGVVVYYQMPSCASSGPRSAVQTSAP